MASAPAPSSSDWIPKPSAEDSKLLQPFITIRPKRRTDGGILLIIVYHSLAPGKEALEAYARWLKALYSGREARGATPLLHIERDYSGLTAWQLTAAAKSGLNEVETGVEAACAAAIRATVARVTIVQPTCMFSSMFVEAVKKQPKLVPTELVKR